MTDDYDPTEFQAVRARIEGLWSGPPIPEGVWKTLVEEGILDRDQDESNDRWVLNALALLQGAGVFGKLGKPPSGRRQEIALDLPDARYDALSEILAIGAGRDPEVVSWRAEHLGDGLVDIAELPAFLARLAGDPKSSMKAIVYAAHDSITYDADDPSWGTVTGWFAGFETPQLTYRRADRTIDGIRVATPPLFSLVGIASSLSRRYEWLEYDAVTFVLTGQVPAWPPMRATLPTVGRDWSRIELSIDPRTPPKAVLRIYEDVRKHLRGDPADLAAKRPPRRLDDKTARLAVFLAKTDSHLTWRERCERWNQAYPRWSYRDAPGFRWAATKAWERIVGERYEVRGGAGEGEDSAPA